MITKIGLNNFRGHTRELEFSGGLNLLVGPNEAGKSTVKEAIAFAWFGTDAGASKNPDHLITFGEDFCEVSVVTENVMITRRKRRGSTSTIKLTRHGFPPVTMTQTELSQLMRMNIDSFMSCWHAGYFMRLPSATKLAVLGELAQVDRRTLLASMLPENVRIPSKVKLLNPKVDADAVAGERRQLQNVKAGDEGQLSQVRAQLEQLKGADAVDIDSYSQALNKVNAELESHDFYRKALAQYQREKQAFDMDTSRLNALVLEQQDLKVTSLENDPRPAQCQELMRKVQEAKTQAEQKKTLIQPMPTTPRKPAIGTDPVCGTCGQDIDESHVKRVTAAYEKELVEFNKVSREVKTHNDEIEAQIQKLRESATGWIQESARLEQSLRTDQATHKASVGRNQTLGAEIARIRGLKDPQAPARPAGDEAALRKEQLDLNTAVNLAKLQKEQLGQIVSRESLLVAAVQEKANQIEQLALIEEALRRLPTEETKVMIKSLAIPYVAVELVEGELAVSSSGVPYTSMSSGKSMKVDWEFCSSLRTAAGSRAPSWIFVDNADLMDKWKHLVGEGVQIFAAKVDPELTELMVVQQ